MATGRVATAQLTSGSITNFGSQPLYTVPTNYYGVYNISFTNNAGTAVSIRMYAGTSTVGSQAASECFEYQTTIPAYGVFERTGLVFGAGTNIIVSSTGTAVSVNVYGIETSTS
jgi:hypothetical protein